LLLIGIGTTYTLGNKQDERSAADQKLYEEAKTMLEKNSGSVVIASLEELQQKYPDDYALMKNLGLAYAQSGNYEQAIVWFDRALKQRPALIQNGIFTAQYGDILYLDKKYKEALALYQNSLQYQNEESVKTYLNDQVKKLSKLVGESESK
jgi:tetratricopeptide (TPR) repeat protein